METLESLGRHLETVNDLRELVRAMKTLSAASINQYERAVEALIEYERTIEMGFQIAMREAPPAAGETEPERTGPVTAVIVGSDHGLCGRFNRDIVGHTMKALEEFGAEPNEIRIVAIGARIDAELEAAGRRADRTFFLPAAVGGIGRLTDAVLVQIEEWRREAGISMAVAYFNRSERGAVGAQPDERQLLPLDRRHLRRLRERPWPSRRLPIHRVDRQTLMASLTRQYIFIGIYRALASSLAAEHNARLNAMQAAESNIEDKLDEMNMAYRRRRQESVTQELMDVVMGFETVTASGTG